MKLTIVVHTAPWSEQAAVTAYRFCQAALDGGHSIHRLFFYSDGVHNTTTLSVPAQDEFDIPLAWRQLVERHGIDTVSCVSSALKRGILDPGEAERHERDCSNLVSASELSGLGQLVDAAIESDRVINFGG